jgi:phosphatidylserine/phosphatidylglycerophosphate/cardiolipin synthase-like enzyme
MIPKAKRMDLSTYVFALPDELRAATHQMLKNGGEFNLFTNGPTGHASVMAPLGVVMNYSYRNIIPMLERAEQTNGKFNVNLYEKALMREADPNNTNGNYNHRKEWIVGNAVFVGSDNFTVSAERKNNESDVMLVDPKLAAGLRKRNADEAGFYRQVDLPQARAEHSKRNITGDICMPLIKILY